MTIDVQCQNCSCKYRLKDEMTGKKFRCKECEAVVTATPIGAVKSKPKTQAPAASPKAKPKSSTRKTISASSARKPAAKKKPVKKKSPPPQDNFDDFGDFEEDDYGDFADDDYGDYEAELPTRKPKKKKSKKKATSKKRSSEGALSNLPPMGFNFNRLNAAMAIGGIVVMFVGFQEMRLAGKSNSAPIKISLADLATNGPSDNVYFTVSGVAPASDAYVYEENSSKRMNSVWIPCQPAEGGPTNFILFSKKTPTDADVVRLMSNATHTGMIINDIQKLDTETKKLLRQGMPQINVDTAHIFQVGRKPSSFLKYGGIMFGGLLLMLAGLFWIFFVH